MENKNKKVLYYVLGAVVLVLLIIFFSMRKDKSSSEDMSLEDTGVEEVSGKDQNQNPSSKTDTKKGTSLTYEQALATYKADRIQFDGNCQATPNYVTYKNGSSIMLDNRSPYSRVIKAGSTFTIPAYGFKILKLSNSTLPVAWFVDCGSSQNVATIIIQK